MPHSRVLACCSKPAAVCGEWLGCSRCDLLAPGGSRTLPSIRRTHCSTSESGRGNSAEATRSSAHAACWIARARRQQDSSSAAKRCRAPDAGTWRMARSAGARAPIERMRVRCRDSDWDTCPIRAHRARYGTPSPDVLPARFLTRARYACIQVQRRRVCEYANSRSRVTMHAQEIMRAELLEEQRGDSLLGRVQFC